MTHPDLVLQVMLAASEIPEPHQIPFSSGMDFSLKLDGVRNYAKDRNAFSRKCELWPNVEVQKFFYDYGAYLQGMDGELIVGPSNAKDVFQKTMSGITSGDGDPDFYFHVFDLWNETSKVAEERAAVLAGRIKLLPLKVKHRIRLVKQHRVGEHAALHAMYMTAIEMDYEGLIGRRADAQYKYGRSTLKEAILLKFKEFADSEIQITRIDQGKSNQNEKLRDNLGKAKRSTAKAGKVLVETIGTFYGIDVNPASPFYGMEVKVGPGDFKKDALADLYTQMKDDPTCVLGKYLTYKYQVAGVKDKPRYPGARCAKGFRDQRDF